MSSNDGDNPELARRHPDDVMTHLALTEGDIEWGDHLTDAEYPPVE